MRLPAISLHQPWATLCATRHPADHSDLTGAQMNDGGYAVSKVLGPFVKRFETRSRPCPPKHIGQRIALCSTVRPPTGPEQDTGDYQINPDAAGGWSIRHTPTAKQHGHGQNLIATMFPDEYGDRYGYKRLPLGAVVATAVITASLPIVQFLSRGPGHRPDPSWTPYDGTGSPPYPLVGLNSNAERLTHYHDGQAADISDQLPYGDWSPGRWAWQLTDVQPLAVPVPHKGRQGWHWAEIPDA